MAQILVTIEKGGDGTFAAYTEELQSVIWGEGNTIEDAKADFYNSFNEVLQLYKDSGTIPQELNDPEFIFNEPTI